MQQQDSSDPTGVSGPTAYNGSSLARARTRKTNAAIQMRLAGATWSEIAEALGYPTPRQALVAVERTLERQLKTEDRDYLRRMAGARLERLLRSVWPKAIDTDHPDHLIAVQRAREIVGQHSKLFGLDAPTEIVVHNPTQAELEGWVAKVVAITLPPVEEYDILEADAEEDEPRALPSG